MRHRASRTFDPRRVARGRLPRDGPLARHGRSAASLGVPAAVARADALPVPDQSCDVAVAAWMLYHVPDLEPCSPSCAGSSDPGGILVVATNGERHLADLLREAGGEPLVTQFTAEVAAPLLRRHFDEVTQRDIETRASFDDHAAAAGYLATFDPGWRALAAALRRAAVVCRPHRDPHRQIGRVRCRRVRVARGGGISSCARDPELVETWTGTTTPRRSSCGRRLAARRHRPRRDGVLAPVLPVDAQPVPVTPSTVTVPMPVVDGRRPSARSSQRTGHAGRHGSVVAQLTRTGRRFRRRRVTFDGAAPAGCWSRRARTRVDGWSAWTSLETVGDSCSRRGLGRGAPRGHRGHRAARRARLRRHRRARALHHRARARRDWPPGSSTAAAPTPTRRWATAPGRRSHR